MAFDLHEGMLMNRNLLIPLALACLGFAGCASLSDRPSRSVPLLESDFFAQNWKIQSQRPTRNGGHQIIYRQGTSLNMVMVESLPGAVPVPAIPPPVRFAVEAPGEPHGAVRERPQPWRTTTILGHPVRWFQVDEGSGADFPAYETVVFPLTHPDGRSGYYRVRVLAEDAASAAKWISKVNWQPATGE